MLNFYCGHVTSYKTAVYSNTPRIPPSATVSSGHYCVLVKILVLAFYKVILYMVYTEDGNMENI